VADQCSRHEGDNRSGSRAAPSARTYFTESLTLSVQITNIEWLAAHLEGLARLAYVQGRWECMTRLFGAAAETAADGEIIVTVRLRLGRSAFAARGRWGST